MKGYFVAKNSFVAEVTFKQIINFHTAFWWIIVSCGRLIMNKKLTMIGPEWIKIQTKREHETTGSRVKIL